MRSSSDPGTAGARVAGATSAVLVLVAGLTSALPVGAAADPPGTATAAATETLWGYEFVERSAGEGVTSLVHRGADERIDVTLLRDVTPEVALAYVDDEVRLFESLYTLKRTGYPGQTTRYIECPPELQPRYVETRAGGNALRCFHAFANANFVAGVSDPELAVHRLIKGYLYCPELAVVFEFEHFCPSKGADLGVAFLERVGCPAPSP